MSAVCPIYVVLGKRLNANQLTLEGKSRVDGLISALQCHENTAARVVFCGALLSVRRCLKQSECMSILSNVANN